MLKVEDPNPRLLDPLAFDPVRFPGVAPDEAWPPAAFDFDATWLADPSLAFERAPSGGIILVRRFEALRLVLDIEQAHSALDIPPASRDFRLLRLMPSALRLVESVSPGDPMPPTLRGEPLPPPEDHQLYAATTALVSALERGSGEAGGAFLDALRRTPPGAHMFELAAARCIGEGGFALERVAGLAKGLQRLACAHAEVLAAAAAQPDYEGMERMVSATTRVLVREAGWSGDLLAHALRQIDPLASVPRETAENLRAAAVAMLDGNATLGAATRLAAAQARVRDRLVELGLFWRRLAAAWASVHPQLTDRREVDGLCRNMLRRLALKALYQGA
ncbi:hypothetical protein [Roseococcus sp.]|uniref:hypothetical protein n=1 Tax=Roseococcus sp. TaxID=2109646 RepID=UPI003BA96D5D